MAEDQSRAVTKYDSISKGAFNVDDVVPIAKKGGPQVSFNQGVLDLLTQAGAPQGFLDRVSVNTVGTTDFMDAISDIAVSAAEFTENTVLAGVMSAIGLEGWIPAAEKMLGRLRTNWKEGKEELAITKVGLLQIGQWVYVNNGRPPAPVPGWHDGLRRRLGAQQNAPGPAQIETEIMPGDRVTVGFYMGSGNRKGCAQVFNFDKFREEEVQVDDIAPCGIDRIRSLEGNDVLSGVRDLKCFPPLLTDRMEGQVPTDPGTEVVFEEHIYHIVRSEGDQVLIEDQHGQRALVTLDALQRGRTFHTNSWNYQAGEEFLGGFTADGAATVYSGQWVWVRARRDFVEKGVTTHELACVWKIMADGIHCFRAFDGKRAVVPEVWPVHDILADVLNRKKSLILFKDASVRGGDTMTASLARTDPLLCLGKTVEAAAQMPTNLTPGEVIIPGPKQVQETVGDRGAKEREDAFQDIAKQTGVAPADLRRSAQDDEDDAMIGTSRSGDSLFGYAVMAGAGLLIWNSVDFSGNLFA